MGDTDKSRRERARSTYLPVHVCECTILYGDQQRGGGGGAKALRTCGPSQWANSSPALLLPAPVLKARPYIEASHTCASYFRTYSVAAKLLCNPDITQFLSQDVEYTTRWYVRFTKSQNKHPLCISSICCTAHPQSCCCCCCCSHINSHQVRGRRAGSSHSGAEEYLQGKNTLTNQRWYTHIPQLTQFMPPPETYKK